MSNIASGPSSTGIICIATLDLKDSVLLGFLDSALCSMPVEEDYGEDEKEEFEKDLEEISTRNQLDTHICCSIHVLLIRTRPVKFTGPIPVIITRVLLGTV